MEQYKIENELLAQTYNGATVMAGRLNFLQSLKIILKLYSLISTRVLLI